MLDNTNNWFLWQNCCMNFCASAAWVWKLWFLEYCTFFFLLTFDIHHFYHQHWCISLSLSCFPRFLVDRLIKFYVADCLLITQHQAGVFLILISHYTPLSCNSVCVCASARVCARDCVCVDKWFSHHFQQRNSVLSHHCCMIQMKARLSMCNTKSICDVYILDKLEGYGYKWS